MRMGRLRPTNAGRDAVPSRSKLRQGANVGYSYSAAASRTMDKIEAACRATRPGEASSNAYFVNGRRYFFEVVRRDQPDGGLRGAIWLCIGETHARRVGYFRINGNGRVERGPKLFKEAAAGPSVPPSRHAEPVPF